VRALALLWALGCLGAPLRASSQYVQEPQLEACGLWNEATHALLEGKLDGKAARERYKALWATIKVDDLPSPKEKHWQWMFPLPGYDAGCFGESYWVDDYRYLDGPKSKGFPGLRLYLRDSGRLGVDDRTKKPAPVVSATDGVVVASEKFWKDADASPLGNFITVLDQQDKLIFTYAHLGHIRVSPGQLVVKGEVVGWVGRTGRYVQDRRLGTHLALQVHTFDDGLFYPVYPGRALRVAGQVAWPVPDGEVRPRIKPPKPAEDVDEDGD
jgi:murein DD-endopeptidase MepM/ murein hydrolase activator NlpD